MTIRRPSPTTRAGLLATTRPEKLQTEEARLSRDKSNNVRGFAYQSWRQRFRSARLIDDRNAADTDLRRRFRWGRKIATKRAHFRINTGNRVRRRLSASR